MQNWSHYAIPILIVLLIVYRRTKRTIGFQKLSRGRLKFRIGIFSIIGLMILAFGFVHPIHFIAYAIGMAAGTALGLTAIRHTRFERRPDAWYYRTHIWVEITVLILFIGRIAYRILFVASAANPNNMNPADPSQFTRDPLTAGIFFVIVTYYLLFFGYLLREEVKLENDEAAADISPGNPTLDK
ncbi:hypothetical protein [Paenibacillus hexagrammi]|uniref:DUF1453 domain-containing protein n=1 Tax=Paenibacillus hexagrammi TaxID=2908839 RepID=A0ABY3SGJ7_9BACL|nr:hypothetical protein [Paenibacillus sp. YPD9-1]UJF32593.1 hypothetical protein L0M14_23565 [Paenibacillus sp. YPD9-1]